MAFLKKVLSYFRKEPIEISYEQEIFNWEFALKNPELMTKTVESVKAKLCSYILNDLLSREDIFFQATPMDGTNSMKITATIKYREP
jgi:hypothetical protein